MKKFSIDTVIALIKQSNQIDKFVNVNLTGKEFISEFDIAKSQSVEMLKELKEYKEAEEQGLLLRLPCEIGFAVYALTPFCEICEAPINEEDACINCTRNHLDLVTQTKFDYEMIPMFGKRIFLNKAEAEAALQKMQEGSK